MSRRAMTLIEMLIALAASLLLMAAIAQVFAVFGGAISGSRAMLDLDGRLRSAAWRLRSDLAGITARTLPAREPAAAEGYLEIIEGPATDATSLGGIVSGTANDAVGGIVSGDHDDVLLFTTRSAEAPFIGRAPTASAAAGALIDTFESPVAEVAWFARPTPGTSDPVTYTLYRRQLLVMGYVGTDPFYSGLGTLNRIPLSATAGGLSISATSPFADFYALPCDVSVRREYRTALSDVLVPNTLADLSRRECRFMHNLAGLTSGGYPFPFVAHQTPSVSGTTEVLPAALAGLVFDATSPRRGEDVILANVLGFDVRLFDPMVPVAVVAAGPALVPGDPGFAAAAGSGPPSASGGFVDLGHGVTSNDLLPAIPPHFGGFGDPRSGLLATGTTRRTYDTWSRHYESDGRDEDGDGIVDESRNGLDDDGNGLIDDAGERETAPPYAFPLRGIEVRIRCYEPTSRQVRQITVRHTFVPH